jgi:lysozyme family protein
MKDSALKNFGILSLAFVLTLLSVGHLAAAPLSAIEKQKIETLIREVHDLKDASFIRNGSTYNSSNAATFLRRKWHANQSEVRTAHDFIEKVASVSGTSGKPYLIRFKDGKEIHSRDFLLAKLKSFEG